MAVTEQEYMKKWLELSHKMSEEDFTWTCLEEGEDLHQYMSYDVYEMSRTLWEGIESITKKAGELLQKTYEHLVQQPDIHKELGIPEIYKDLIKVPSPYFSYFTRFDIIVNDDGVKIIEVNCDTPTGYLETSVGNDIICKEHGLRSPNALEFNIFSAWREIDRCYRIGSKKVFFTSFGDHEEDRQTVLFNMKHSGMNAEYVAVEDILVAEDGLYAPSGERIEFLYRLYPLEFLQDDIVDGDPIGHRFIEHIRTENVKIINPPSAFMMQSKAVFAKIHELYHEGFYTKEEEDFILRHIPSTYFGDKIGTFRFNKGYVTKPVYGREGGGVKIYDRLDNLTDQDSEEWYSEWPKIQQEYVHMPDFTVNTWEGPYTGKLLIGSFLINGNPSGLFLRVGEKITGNLSMFTGVALKED